MWAIASIKQDITYFLYEVHKKTSFRKRYNQFFGIDMLLNCKKSF